MGHTPLPDGVAGSIGADESLHRSLNAINTWRLDPALPSAWTPAREREEQSAREAERLFVEGERAAVARALTDAPTNDPDAFVAWFASLERTGPGQHDPLFDWLESDASLASLRTFLHHEVAGEAGFDDLVALSQVKMPARPKLEMARNYWDEMGQGHASGMHGPMLSRLAEELGIGRPDPATVVWEALALGNLMMALASHRTYAFHAVGALGAIELTAPGRAAKVNAGLKRLGVGGEARRYFALHATLDVKHADAWMREVLRPLAEKGPEVARAMGEGALLRLRAGARCFDRYRWELGLHDLARAAS